MSETLQATPHEVLIAQIKDSTIAKNEHGWAAANEIERLERENAELREILRRTRNDVDHLMDTIAGNCK